ncbi:peptidoglycan-binding protein [Lachnospiraceae bacterium ZAX-1]
MYTQNLHYMQTESVDKGTLQVQVQSRLGYIPIQNARVTIAYATNPEDIIEELVTDSSGQTQSIELSTPPLEYSMEPGQPQPYSNYIVTVEAPEYQQVKVTGTELFSGEKAIQDIRMNPQGAGIDEVANIAIPPNTLFGDFPPKIAEAEIKPVADTGEIVLSRVVVPEYMVVHDGTPGDNTAENYYVKYRDYIKNVASSEIYSTWPESTIRANVLAIMSFSLNRVYTEWYRNKGYDFTVTTSTAYDQKYIYGRNIFSNISLIVDEIFANYLSRPNVKQPILTQYCDGERVTCPNWLSQWGSKYLGDQNYNTIDIIRYYYGNNMYVNEAEEISGIPSSWPGETLSVGASGSKVRQMQEQLARISQTYTAIPTPAADGAFGPGTERAVREFQRIFDLPATGVVDYATWYKISAIYVAVSRLAELV